MTQRVTIAFLQNQLAEKDAEIATLKRDAANATLNAANLAFENKTKLESAELTIACQRDDLEHAMNERQRLRRIVVLAASVFAPNPPSAEPDANKVGFAQNQFACLWREYVQEYRPNVPRIMGRMYAYIQRPITDLSIGSNLNNWDCLNNVQFSGEAVKINGTAQK